MRPLPTIAAVFIALATATASQAQAPKTEEKTFTVQAAMPWQDTGVTVGGNPVAIRVTGGVWTANPTTGMVGPGGNPRFIGKPGYALPGAPEGMLIGRVGKHVFPVGAGSSIPPGIRGKLELVINDDVRGRYGKAFGDNRGALTVAITIFKAK